MLLSAGSLIVFWFSIGILVRLKFDGSIVSLLIIFALAFIGFSVTFAYLLTFLQWCEVGWLLAWLRCLSTGLKRN